jgi:uncharacterized membrane protein
MFEKIKQYTLIHPRLKKTIGIVLVVFGLFALIAPLVPGAILALVGLELLGIRLAFFERFRKAKPVPVIVDEPALLATGSEPLH